MNEIGVGFRYLICKFQSMTETKIKLGTLVGLQIKQLLHDFTFKNKLNALQKITWDSL